MPKQFLPIALSALPFRGSAGDGVRGAAKYKVDAKILSRENPLASRQPSIFNDWLAKLSGGSE